MIKIISSLKKYPKITFGIIILFATVYFLPALVPNSPVQKNANIRIQMGKFSGAAFIDGDVLIKFKPGIKRKTVNQIAASHSSNVLKSYHALTKVDACEYALLRSKSRNTVQMIEGLKHNPNIEAISPNFLHHVDSIIPNDTYFEYLWGLHNTGQTGGTAGVDINAPEAWSITTGSASVIVGVIDTGIDYNHPDLIPNLWINPGEVADGVDNDGNGYVDDIYGINAINGSGDPLDDHSHGTHCAGIIGAVGNNDMGVAGVNWNVKLIGTKFIDATGYGSDADALECINYLIDLKNTHGQNIVAANASFGGGDYDPVLESAITSMGDAGIVFCAAAGNDWSDNDAWPHYPSSYGCFNIISVTALDFYGWQNFNWGKTSVDLAAPGVDILSTTSGLYYPQVGDIFFDDMESGAGNWITGGINNSWAITTEQEIFDNGDFPVPSPPHFWSDSPGTYYLPDTDSWLMTSSDIDLSSYIGQDLFIGFGSAVLLEQYVDHGYVEVSGDGGSTWHALADYAGAGFYWYIPWNFLIPDFVKTANFRFRFHLVTDFSIEYDGWLLDDIGIGSVNFYGYEFKSGTSMAAPHVTGAVALIAALFPSETVEQRISRILNNVTPMPSLIDICVTEGMLNLESIACLPGVPENPLPADMDTDLSIYTLLDWDDCAGADSYDVYFGTTSSPPFAANVSDSVYDPGTLTAGITYFWKVTAKNSCSELSGPEWQFTTMNCPTPNTPADPLPLQGAVDILTSADLDWGDCAGATSYDVYLGTISPPPLVGTTSDSTYDPGSLNFDQTYFWRVSAKNGCGETPGPEWSFVTESAPVLPDYYVFHGHDFTGNGKSDIAVWKPSNGRWYIRGGSWPFWGDSGDVCVNGDYDGDGTTDIAVWKPTNGRWYIRGQAWPFWGSSGDIPVPGDYDGDTFTEVAVWRPTNGRWYIQGMSGPVWGASGDLPVPADYDGDGQTDVAVWHPADGTWYIQGQPFKVLGQTGDIPVPADYDGDGLTEAAVWRPAEGRWYIEGQAPQTWGELDDIPVPGDFDGDGTAEIAVWRPSNGRWYVKGLAWPVWGDLGDIPLVR